MDPDYEALLWEESGDIAQLIDEIDDPDFDVASLCEGWRVRDVVSHMIVGHTTPMPSMLMSIAKYGFNVPKGSKEMSHEYGSAHTPDQIRTAWSGVADDHTMKGISQVIPKKEGFTDHLIHNQDMRRPLGRPREIAPERLSAALDALPTIGGFLKSKQRMKGLRWVATDIGWDSGQGPEVHGAAEALILAAAGRPVVLDELSGDGVDTLTTRMPGG